MIPSTVTEFGEDIFKGCSNSLVLYGAADSATAIYASENNLTFAPCKIDKISMLSPVPDGILEEGQKANYHGHTYQLLSANCTWHEMKAYCESIGGYLACITSAEENNFLYEYMMSYGDYSAFFGFTDEVNGTWAWISGEAVTYTNWYPGEPNNSKPGEHWGHYSGGNGKWNDTIANVTRYFLCEWDYETLAISDASYFTTVAMNAEIPLPLSVTVEQNDVIWEIPATDTIIASGGKTVHILKLDLSVLESGVYQFHFANSNYGIDSAILYDVDRTAPNQPENFRIIPGKLKNTLAWDAVKEADVTSIRIYRTTDETAEPELLTALSGRAAVTYTDNGLEDSVTYYYWLSFVDKFSQESEKAGPVAGTPTSDNEPPSITTVYPADGTTLTGSVSFRVTASDNQRVKSVAMEISTEVGESASWETLETVDTTGQAEFTLDSTRYNVDALYVRFLAEDTSGNTAYSKLTYTFPVDNTPPETVSSITGEASATSITLHWTYDAPSDFSHFTLEKRDGSGAYAKVGGNLTSLGAQINNLTPGTEYSFRVMAFDIHGNHSEYSEEYSFTTSADTDAPVITAMSPQPGRYNGSIPLLFTATDNDSIQSMTYQTSNDGLEWTDMTTITVASANKTAAVSYSLNTASFEEGVLYVRAVAADASGNVSDTSNNAPYTQYMVDRTASAAPRALEGVSVSGAVYLTWLQGTEQDLNGYTVERAYEENGSYSALATAWKKLSYTDSGVAAGQTYYYRLRSQDTAGNASAYSEVVAVTVETVPDTEAPRIVSVSPSDGYILGSNTPIRVSVSDNQLVATLSVQYSVDGENWNSLEEITVSATSGVVTLPLTASDIDSDALSLCVSCTDGVGLTSGTVSRAYSIDTTPPAAPVITVEAAAMSVVLNWTSGNESDLAGFYIYRKAGGESEYSYLAQCGKNTTSYTDSKVIAERNYSYYVSAIDARSNQSPSAPTEAVKPLNIDVEPPVIRASGDTTGTVGIEMQFSAKNTTDNFGASGLSYAWNFGDSETSSLLEPRHTYQSAGSYTISLTVTDAAGNSSSGQISVTVKEATEAAWLDVTVKDDSGNPISGAGVYFDLGEEEQETVYTNDSGVARVTAKEGTFTVGVYKNGYLPEKAENVTLIKGAVASITVQLVKKDIVTGRLTVEPMTLEEIVAAGIDTADPANQQVFQYEITLTYGSEPVNIQTRVNGNGKILVDPEPITVKNSGGEKRVLQTFVFSGTDTDFSNVHAPTWNGGANAPIVAVIDLPGETTWLKDFFDVHLYVINQAAPDFVLDDCRAVLNVPDGLTLMDSNRTAATPDRNMGSIAGQRSASAEWIVRGDKGGDYTLSADFSATLREFNESVTARFETAEPFHVRQGDNLSLDIVVENAIISGADGAVRIGLRNDDTNPYYLPSMRIGHGASLIRSFKTNGRTAVSGNMNALNPGETIWWDYRIPREEWNDLSEHSDKDFWLTDAVMNALGGDVTLNAFIRRVTPFTIDGDLIEVYKITPQGEKRPISYINAQKSSNNVPIPDLLIRTYRLDEQQQYVPCSMEVTIQDEKRPSDVILMSKGVGSAVTDANGELLLPGYVWNPKHVTEGGIMEGGWVTEQEKSYTIRISSKRSMPIEIPVAIMETDEYGHLELHVYEKDGNNMTALDDGVNVTLTDGTNDYTVEMQNDGLGHGQYDASNVPKGQLTISVEKEGYLPCTFDYTQKKMTVLRICLRKDDDPSQSRIVNISNTLSKNSYNYTIVPLNHIKAGESIVVRPFSRIADGDAFQTYRYRIVHEESVTESGDFAGELIFPLSVFQVGDSLEIALVTQNQGECAYVDSGISFVNSPDIFKEFGEWFFDLAGIVNKDEISVPELFEMPKTKAKEVTGASFVGTGTFIPESTGQETKNLTGVISDYTVVGAKASQKYPLSVQYDSSGKFTFSIIAGGEASITQSKERWAKTSGFSDPPPKDFSKDSSMFKVEQKSTSEKSWGIENSVRLDIIVQYEPSLNCWTADAKGSVDGGVEICLFKGALPLGPLTVVELFAKLDTEFGYAGTWSIGHMEFRENSEDTLFSNGLYPEELALNGTLNASVGAELISNKIASVCLYALAGLGIELAPDAKITGKFGMGTKENVLFWKAEQKWFEDEWEKPIHSSASLQGAIDSYSLRMGEATQRASAMLLNAGDEGTFVVSQNASGMDWTGAALGTLVRDACDQTDAQLVALPNGGLLMVWVGYTGVESNPLALYSAVYDGGAWSEPELVCDDGKPDIYPALLASTDGANLLWVSAKEAFSSGMQSMTQNEIEEFASDLLELRVKHYDADSGWEEQTATIETGEIPHRPALAVHDNEIVAVWLNDSGIAWRILDADDGTTLGSGNLDAPQGELTGGAVGYGNSGFVASAAAICDDAAMAYHANLTQGIWYEGTSVTSVDAVCGAEDGTRFFISDGCLLAGKSSQITRILRSDYFELSASGISCSQTSDGYALVWSSRVEDGYALCACVLSNTLEVIREPFVIEESDNALYSMADAVYVNGSLSVSYCKLDYSQDSIVDTLEFISLGSSVDLALKESGVYSSNFLTPGAKITTYVQAEDRGLASSGGIRAEIRDGDTLICAKEAENSLNLTLQWTVPEDYGGSRYQLTVLPLKGTDANADNNSILLDNVICCASVDSVLYQGRMDDNVLISAVVTNNGISETGELSLQVKSLSRDKTLYEQKIESVAFDSGVSVNIALKESDVEQEMLAFLLTSPNPAVECHNNYLSLLAAESEQENTSSTTFSITLHPNGGVISGELTSYISGTETVLPTNVTRDNYTFGGWYETENFEGEPVTEISETDTGDKTFYAKWISVVLGDINGDESVSMKDLSLLRRYLNGWEVQVVPEAMDVNSDGSVTMKDFSLLRRYLNGWPVTLGANDAGLLGGAKNREPGEIAVGTASAKAGDTVTIPLTFKSNPGIVAYRLYVSYDKDALELLEGKAADFESVSFGPVESVPFNILWDESLNGNVTGAATIAELTFRIKEGTSGYSSVSVTYNPSDIYDRDLANVPFNVSNGGIEIVSSTGENRLRKVTVTGGSGSGEYGAGDSVTIHADPPPKGKVFDRWTGTNGIQFISGSQNSADAIFRMPDGDVALNATFRDQKLQGCYVATAVYGSYDCPEVWTLRRFRDNVLAKTWYGRLFIRLYYTVSPTAVRLFGDARWFRDFWRERLDRMVTELQSEGFESTPYMDRDWN